MPDISVATMMKNAPSNTVIAEPNSTPPGPNWKAGIARYIKTAATGARAREYTDINTVIQNMAA